MRVLLIIFIFFAGVSCNSGSQEGDTDAEQRDTLMSDLNTPELRDINNRIVEDPGNAELYHKRALIYYHLQELSPAVNDARRAIRIDSTNAAYYLTLVDVYFSQNSTRQAKDLLEIIEKRFPENTEALLKLAELYWLVRQYQKGIDYVNKALRINEHLARGYYIKGGIYRESGDTARAVSSLETAVEQDNSFIEAYHDLGVIFSARKNPLALQYFDNVLRIAPENSDARYGRARLLQDIGKTDEAVAEYEAIIKSDPACAQCHYNIGAIMLEIKSDNRKALERFSEAISIDPSFAQAYFARGYTYTKLNDNESAKADYKTCLRISPGFEAAIDGLNALD